MTRARRGLVVLTGMVGDHEAGKHSQIAERS